MSKFNIATKPSKPDTINRAGGQAYVQTPEVALVNLLLTSFMKDKYYETAKDEQTRLEGLLSKVDPVFAAKAAIYARTRFGMRSITHFTAAWIAKNVKGSKWTKEFFSNLVSGFSDKVFDTMALLETDRLALVKEINAIDIGERQ